MEFLKTNGSDFCTAQKTTMLKGVGLGNWLTLEHFMFGWPGTDSQIRQAIEETYGTANAQTFWERYYSAYVDEADIAFVQKCGMNHVRIPVNYKLFQASSIDQSVAIREIDRILPFLRKYNIWAIIDLHAVPGGQNPDWHSDNYTGRDSFWTDTEAINNVVEIWSDIAEYYKNEPAIGGYDLINEPCYFSKDTETVMVDFFRTCTSAIRKHDQNHIIFYTGNTYGRDFSMFTENLDDNSSFTFHLYPFLQIPDAMDSANLEEKLEESLYNDVTFEHLQSTLKKPLWCGETGHQHHQLQSVHALHKFTALLEANNTGWALWPLKDCGAMGLISAAKNGKWNALCAKISDNWSFWNLFTKDSILSAEQEDDKYKYYEWLAKESTLGWETVRKNLQTVPFADLLDALNDFTFENCTETKELLPHSFNDHSV